MARSSPVVAFSAIGHDEEKRPEPPAAATTRAVTGLEDPAISDEALAAAEANRRLFDRGLFTSLSVELDGLYALDDWLETAQVKREWQKAVRDLARAEAGTGSIQDVNMFYPMMCVELDLMDRFAHTHAGLRHTRISTYVQGTTYIHTSGINHTFIVSYTCSCTHITWLCVHQLILS